MHDPRDDRSKHIPLRLIYTRNWSHVVLLQTFSVISRKSMEGQDVAESLLAEDIPGYERALAEWNEKGHGSYKEGSLA